MVQELIFYGAYAYFPLLAAAMLAIINSRRWVRWLSIFVLIPTTLLAWARFVEPAILNVKHTDILIGGAAPDAQVIRVAVFADTHFGKFGNAMPMARIVDATNRQEVDLVLIAGDFLYHPELEQISSELSELSRLRAPTYAIFGNHDVGRPGPNHRDAVRDVFEAMDIPLLEDEAEQVEVNGQALVISGVRDLWYAPEVDTRFAADIPADVPHITLAHNPDTAMVVPASFDYDLMVAGHTHGGQIRLPFLYKSAIPCEGDWDKDLHIWRDAGGVDRQVWVTPGTGMVGLPFRFLQPPRLDILTLHLPEASPSP
ncbi:MAG: metallophosphoesterase [Pseudomonadota bacterium]